MAFPLLPLRELRFWIPFAEAFGVSEVARSDGAFLFVYSTHRVLPLEWQAKREAFLARHTGQLDAKKRRGEGEALWQETEAGIFIPSRRHLSLIMWAYSPHRIRLLQTKALLLAWEKTT